MSNAQTGATKSSADTAWRADEQLCPRCGRIMRRFGVLNGRRTIICVRKCGYFKQLPRMDDGQHDAYRPRRWRPYYSAWITEKHIDAPPGTTRVLTVIRESGKGDIPWDVLQTIKDEMLGPDVYAIEVYPPHDEIVAEEFRRHLWEVPSVWRKAVPFNLHPEPSHLRIFRDQR